MRGTIKFVDAKTGQWGFILREDGGPDVHFSAEHFLVEAPWGDDRGAEVSFEIEGEGRQKAIRIAPTFSPGPTQTLKAQPEPGRALLAWASIPQSTFLHRD